MSPEELIGRQQLQIANLQQGAAALVALLRSLKSGERTLDAVHVDEQGNVHYGAGQPASPIPMNRHQRRKAAALVGGDNGVGG